MDRDREPDPRLASELRSTAGQDWNQEAAEDERLTEVHRRRTMSLGDHAKELVNRGDRVSVDFGGHSFNGLVAAAGSDYATINGPGQVADVRLEEARWSILPSDITSDSNVAGAESFKALLSEHSAGGKVMRLALPGGDMVIGTITVVADDHVEVSDVDGRSLLVPMKLVLAIVRSADVQ